MEKDVMEQGKEIKGVLTAQAQRPSRSLLPSGRTLLDEFLDGGLRWGELSEWGLPWGQGLRDIILWFLARSQKEAELPCWTLWVYSQSEMRVNPLAWYARGLNLDWLRFVNAEHPVKDLKPLFLSEVFRILVIDDDGRLSADDCAFLARQARRHQQAIFLLRPYHLSERRGNVWARTRINCWHDFGQQRVFAKIIKGHRPRQITWPFEKL
jgi:hypothetical protein